MQLVIDIPEEMYQTIKETNVVISGRRSGRRFDYVLFDAVSTGAPLPKVHGRLGDLDSIWNKLKELEEYYQAEFLKESNAIHESAMSGRLYGFTNSKFIVQDAPTIIEADKEVEDAGGKM